jgi:site-specific recombinase XerD
MPNDASQPKPFIHADVTRWYRNLSEGSELTADTYLRRLRKVCETFRTTPEALAKYDSKAAYNFLLDLVAHYRQRGVAGSTIKGYVKPIRSWFTHSDIVISKPIRINGANKTPSLKDEKTPEPYELNSVWKFCNPRQAAEIALMAFAGVRPQVLGNYHGSDGLRIHDIPELEVGSKSGKIVFRTIPTRILIRDDLSKMGYNYEAFLCAEGCMTLEKYLLSRMEVGEEPASESPVIAEMTSGRPLSTKTICQDIRHAFREAGFQWRPYILRRYFDTRMGQASARAELGLPDSWVTFWMGHAGDIETLYRLRKRLPDSLLEQMRHAYRRSAETMLQTTKLDSEDATTVRREFRAVALTSVGFSEDELKRLDLDRLTVDEFQQLIRTRLGINQVVKSRKEIVVTASEAKDYINTKGWRFKGSMATGDVVIESPP